MQKSSGANVPRIILDIENPANDNNSSLKFSILGKDAYFYPKSFEKPENKFLFQKQPITKQYKELNWSFTQRGYKTVWDLIQFCMGIFSFHCHKNDDKIRLG
jgi:hypothetical protein